MDPLKELQAAYAVEGAREPWPTQGEWTYEDYVRLPEDTWKYEIIEGVLYMAPSPTPEHQRVIVRILLTMGDYVSQKRSGEVFASPLDVILPDQLGSPVQPDLFYIRQERRGIVKEQHIEGAPDLVVEVLSPSNWVDDRRVKFKAYARAGISEYWIVDPVQETVEVFVRSEEGVYGLLERFAEDDIVRSKVLAGFTMPVSEIFST